MKKELENRVVILFNSDRKKFETKRQASKYLNKYGRVYKAEKNIDITAPKREITR